MAYKIKFLGDVVDEAGPGLPLSKAEIVYYPNWFMRLFFKERPRRALVRYNGDWAYEKSGRSVAKKWNERLIEARRAIFDERSFKLDWTRVGKP